jgi:hypothetical protein
MTNPGTRIADCLLQNGSTPRDAKGLSFLIGICRTSIRKDFLGHQLNEDVVLFIRMYLFTT